MQLDVLDGNYLVSSSNDKTLRLWDVRRYMFPFLLLFQLQAELFTSFGWC
jgi:WD40 repeat protein